VAEVRDLRVATVLAVEPADLEEMVAQILFVPVLLCSTQQVAEDAGLLVTEQLEPLELVDPVEEIPLTTLHQTMVLMTPDQVAAELETYTQVETAPLVLLLLGLRGK
jgi:hypothetical protein